MPKPSIRLLHSTLALGVAALLAACATTSEPPAAPRKEIAFGLTETNELIKFNTGEPQRVLSRMPVKGLAAGEQLLGIDFRVSRGVLYTLSQSGQLYTLDTATAELKKVGTGAGYTLVGNTFGFDFNPAADRIRVVSDTTLNLRLHPETGAAVDGNPNMPGLQADGDLHYVAGDANAGKKPTVVAAGYTYNKTDEKITTNYAIDRDLGVLAMQGSLEGTTPVVSPNTGDLRTVGPLGLGKLRDASFDIADVSNAGFAVIRTADDLRARLYLIDLKTGGAKLLGTVDQGRPLLGLAIEP
ncbi:DUF4394 domain-containing protein [Pseudorhodoferax sp. Leaf267]|uniref:DUF4394 domain-containing protein n=1 Tax=Pseudorhodoferax sp. Leaf267 TaxID=1736316 RepID=UPI0006F1C7C6|nr:DUF4394 domain-containing protein [Pseudorhodoferax sp. Leaf267]KQP23566.1 hypothetical protein ASF43_01015 [Pseudorhodoferax sp. Leaf267]